MVTSPSHGGVACNIFQAAGIIRGQGVSVKEQGLFQILKEMMTNQPRSAQRASILKLYCHMRILHQCRYTYFDSLLGNLDNISEGDPEEPSEDSTSESAQASTTQPNNIETIMTVGHVNIEASGSLTGEHIIVADAHRAESGTSEGSGTQKFAGGKDSAGPKPDARLQGLFVPKLVEIYQKTRGVVDGLSATMLQLQSCLEESECCHRRWCQHNLLTRPTLQG
ncbi:uncharacterized protein LOC144504735 [Mustelus asterias]